MTAPLSKQLEDWSEGKVLAEVLRSRSDPGPWPGDVRPLWRRALDQREFDQGLARQKLRKRAAQANGRKGGLASRAHPSIAVGNVFGSWRVRKLLGRGYQGRADMRVLLVCDGCGAERQVFEFLARKPAECRHANRGQP
jgi:hypothetical protein